MICVTHNQEIRYLAKSWNEVEAIYELLLKDDFAGLIEAIS